MQKKKVKVQIGRRKHICWISCGEHSAHVTVVVYSWSFRFRHRARSMAGSNISNGYVPSNEQTKILLCLFYGRKITNLDSNINLTSCALPWRPPVSFPDCNPDFFYISLQPCHGTLRLLPSIHKNNIV